MPPYRPPRVRIASALSPRQGVGDKKEKKTPWRGNDPGARERANCREIASDEEEQNVTKLSLGEPYIIYAAHRPHIIQYTKLYLYIYVLYIIQAAPPCIMQPWFVWQSYI